jgi:hypothetical protein
MSPQLLGKSEVEEMFVRAATGLGVKVILDTVDLLPERSVYRICCHDSFGPIPYIEVSYADDRDYVFDRVSLTLERLYLDVGY